MTPFADAMVKVSESDNSHGILWMLLTYLIFPFIIAVALPQNGGGLTVSATSSGHPPPLPHESVAGRIVPSFFDFEGIFLGSFRKIPRGMLELVWPAFLLGVMSWKVVKI